MNLLFQLSVVICVIGVAVAVILWFARPPKCTHPRVTFEGLQSGALVECRDCSRIVEWHEVGR